MIEVTNLAKQYNETFVVNHISFVIREGEICGYLGPNGAGKTTTVRLLTGMIMPTSGVALIDGINVVQNPLAVKERIGYVPESGAVYETLTPMEYLKLVGRLHHLDDRTIEHTALDFLDFFDIREFTQQQMNTFSKGMRQKVVITAAMLHNPSVLFFDEPLNGLDANATLLFKELVRTLARQGKTVFYTSHILDVVEKMCNSIIILNKGNIVAQGAVDELKTMTQEVSLEHVFNKLTRTEDLETKARTLMTKITQR
jgi:ABC-2 type transport system ATP-binding protein